jgi:hypothetical protein
VKHPAIDKKMNYSRIKRESCDYGWRVWICYYPIRDNNTVILSWTVRIKTNRSDQFRKERKRKRGERKINQSESFVFDMMIHFGIIGLSYPEMDNSRCEFVVGERGRTHMCIGMTTGRVYAKPEAQPILQNPWPGLSGSYLRA